jgi:hypothetical protein
MALLTVALSLIGFYFAYSFAQGVYAAFLGPLKNIPGPKIRAFSNVPYLWARFNGLEAQSNAKLHAQYGHVVQVAPNKISYTNGATAWKDIYGFKRAGKLNFPKDPAFMGTPINGAPSIINSDDETHARHRYVHHFEHSGKLG